MAAVQSAMITQHGSRLDRIGEQTAFIEKVGESPRYD
jgi:hypothetical protein